MYSPIPIKRSSKFGNNYWEHTALKVERNVRLFSDLEYDFWVLIETNPQVRAFCERPLKIEQMYEGKLMKVMFDMWVKWENKNEQFVEIRYSNKSRLSWSIYEKYDFTQQWCRNTMKKTLLLKLKKKLRGNKILLSNMKRFCLTLTIVLNLSKQTCIKVERQLSKVKRCSIASLSQQLNINPARIRESIY